MIPKGDKSEINDKRIIFVEQYLVHNRNATIAYKAVYGQDLSDNTAAVNASRLLRNPKIQGYLKARFSVLELDSDYVLVKLKNLAESAKTDNTKLQAVITIGKLLGMFSDNLVINQKTADAVRQEKLKDFALQIIKSNGPRPGETNFIR